MPITKDVNNVIQYTRRKDTWEFNQVGVIPASDFAIADDIDVLKQIQFSALDLPTNTQVVLKAPSASGIISLDFGSNSLVTWEGAWGTTPTSIGLAATSVSGANRTYAATDANSRRKRSGYATNSAAGTVSSCRGLQACQVSAGFDCRWFVQAGTTGVADSRAFVGLLNSTAALTNVEYNTLINAIGIVKLSTSNTWGLMNNDSTGTASITDLGSDFLVDGAAIMFRMMCPPGSTSVWWWVTQVNTGANANGIITSDLPTVALAPQLAITNNTTAANAFLDLVSLTLRVNY